MKAIHTILFMIITLFYNSCKVDCTLVVIITEETAGGITLFHAEYEGAKGAVHYSWSNGSTSPNIYPDVAGLYTVTVTDDKGCKASNSYTYSPGATACDVSTITDADGNVYNVITIGNQCWMKENLRKELDIPYVADSAEWADNWTFDQQNLALCYLNNDPDNLLNYGVLYNWYAVQLGDLCPDEWHVPTTADWNELLNFLGGESLAGLALQDDTGFAALMGSYRLFNGIFYTAEDNTVFWTSTELDADAAFSYSIIQGFEMVVPAAIDKNHGLSCRCVHD